MGSIVGPPKDCEAIVHTEQQTLSSPAGQPRRVIIVGLGNIGSHLLGLVVRMLQPGDELVLIDHDAYLKTNIPGQNISAVDLGSKVAVQARIARRINPALKALPIRARVEDVPLGDLRGCVILACLDSRAARRYVNRAAWRLGIPWIDGGVGPTELLVRANVYVPGPQSPCMECAWDATDIAQVEQEYPCLKDGWLAPATNAPAALGAMVASLMTVECRKLMEGDHEHLLAGREVRLDLRHHTHWVTSFRRQSTCKFDHATWTIDHLDAPPARIAISRAFKAANGSEDADGLAIAVEGHQFTRALFCQPCGNQVPCSPRLERRIPAARRRCPQCGGVMVARGWDMTECLEYDSLDSRDRRRSLGSLGLRSGDIITVRTPGGDRHFQLGCRPEPARPAAPFDPQPDEEIHHA